MRKTSPSPAFRSLIFVSEAHAFGYTSTCMWYAQGRHLQIYTNPPNGSEDMEEPVDVLRLKFAQAS